MDKRLLKVALRQNAIYIPQDAAPGKLPASDRTLAFVAEMAERGYTLSQKALCAVNALNEDDLQSIVDVVNEVYGIGLNWAAMVKDWQRPKNVTAADYFVTLVANIFPDHQMSGVTLPCGHFIPDDTFPLERYNGCPFCGTPFVWSTVLRMGQRKPPRTLDVIGDEGLRQLMYRLLQSGAPLDATMTDSLKLLCEVYPVPTGVDIPVRETVIAVASVLIPLGRSEEISSQVISISDVLRLIWYSKTGQARVFTPKVFIKIAARNHRYDLSLESAIDEARKQLRLHFTRTECKAFARLIENLPQSPAAMCEAMNPKREMWMRVIRALRLNEYARRLKLPRLTEMLDMFYNKTYPVWGGEVERAKDADNEVLMYELLRQRPGEFARRLFSTMLRFRSEIALDEFGKILYHVKPRLILTLASFAEIYFEPYPNKHWVKPRPDVTVEIDGNQYLKNYTEAELEGFKSDIRILYLKAMEAYFKSQPHKPGTTVYISPDLFDIPVPVGDRSSTVSDAGMAFQGQQFKVSGDVVRLFMQWGKGLPAQHLDMDLSARLIYKDGTKAATCAYYQLDIDGCHHSGDIINIPDRVGAAEYIEMNLDSLKESGVEYVAFCCNAFSGGAIKPGVVVGWMNAESPMTVNNDTGVAYDPSTVEHQVRIADDSLSKGLVFGVLDVDTRTITWLELPLNDRLAASLSTEALTSILKRLRNKVSIGQVLALKAEVQGLKVVPEAKDAGIVYDNPGEALDFL